MTFVWRISQKHSWAEIQLISSTTFVFWSVMAIKASGLGIIYCETVYICHITWYQIWSISPTPTGLLGYRLFGLKLPKASFCVYFLHLSICPFNKDSAFCPELYLLAERERACETAIQAAGSSSYRRFGMLVISDVRLWRISFPTRLGNGEL